MVHDPDKKKMKLKVSEVRRAVSKRILNRECPSEESDRWMSLSHKGVQGVLGACGGPSSHCPALSFPKVKRSREKRSLASRLSGYIPPKKKQGQGSSLPENGESLGCTSDRVLSTVAVLTLS